MERHAGLVLAACLAVTSIVLVHVLDELKVDTSTTEMISEDVAFRRNDMAFDRAFPQLDDTIVAVIDAATPEQADDAAARLAAWLRSDQAHFHAVYVPGEESFFRQSSLLYLSAEDLANLADRLANAQPLLATLAQDPTLHGFAEILAQAASAEAEEAAGLVALFERMQNVVEAMEHGLELKLSWLALFAGDGATSLSTRRFVIVQPTLDHGSLQPAAAAMAAFRAGIRDLDAAGTNGVAVRLTGSAAVDHEELESVQLGGLAAATAAFILDALLLVAGLRSWRLVFATVLTLLIGLVWTAGFATVAFGELNLISVAFAVLFLGLAVDFSIHFCLRFREEGSSGRHPSSALAATAGAVGGAIILSAVSAAAGFLSFVPTDYKGLAELGMISAAGMCVATLANFIVLPALLKLLPLTGAEREVSSETRLVEGIARRYPRQVILASFVLGLAGLASIPFLRFDFDPIHLKDPRMESVATFLDLARDPRTTPYTIDILAADLDMAADVGRRLAGLSQVGDVLTLRSFVPESQTQKLAIIEDMAYFVGPALESQRPASAPIPTERRQAFARIQQSLLQMSDGEGALAETARDLHAALRRLSAEPYPSDSLLRDLESRLTGYLPTALDHLREALEARPVGIEDLPAELRSRWLSADGTARVEVHPAHSPLDRSDLRRFVETAQSVAPNAVGTPVIITEAADIVAKAFATATIIAASLVVLILLVVLRNIYDVLLVVLPLVLAGALTSLTATAAGLPLNFANIIALPLLFGLGVSSAIHVVLRWRKENRQPGPVPSSTSRSVLYSALTTVAAVGSLVISGHPGMMSMGYLLTISIAYTLVSTLFVLPSLIAWVSTDTRR